MICKQEAIGKSSIISPSVFIDILFITIKQVVSIMEKRITKYNVPCDLVNFLFSLNKKQVLRIYKI